MHDMQKVEAVPTRHHLAGRCGCTDPQQHSQSNKIKVQQLHWTVHISTDLLPHVVVRAGPHTPSKPHMQYAMV